MANPQINDLISRLPIDQIAQRLGTDQQSALAAVQAAVPSLVAGMQSNASSPQGAQSLLGALGQHQGQFGDVPDLQRVDEADGQKIVQHALGQNTEPLAQQLSAAGPAGIDLGALVKKVLPIVAPFVLAWLADQVMNRGGASAPGQSAPSDQGQASGGLGGLVEDLIKGAQPGGAAGGPAQSPAPGGLGGLAGGGLGDLLGGILGGGAKDVPPVQAPQGGQLDLGSILGGLLGGRR